MAEKLKPCPYCGGEARLVVLDSEGNVHDESYETDPYSGLSYAIVHGSDDCCGECPVSTSDPLPWMYETREEAAAAWNRRAERTCHVATKERRFSQTQTLVTKSCSSCGHEFGSEEVRPILPTLDETMVLEAVDVPNYCPHCGARVVSER